jgi:hypothetical protein
VQPPHPTPEQSYMFERPITFTHGDGSTSAGRIDCYRRGHFVWESKKLKDGERQAAAGSRRFDDALLRARTQAENYARALPAAEGRPPFVVVVDVGHVIELYAEFTRSGATYTPFPDPRSHRIRLEQLADPAIRKRLKALWTDPLSLDPSRASARVTREVAAELAELAKSLEAAGHTPHHVAGFLTRCLFSMFAEDVGLLPKSGPEGLGSFVHLLRQHREQPATLAQMLKIFWAGMDAGGFNAAMPPTCCASTASCSRARRRTATCCRSPPRRSTACCAPPAPTGPRWSPPSSAPCWSARSTPPSATPWARTTRHAPMWSAWCCPPWWSPCAPTGPTPRPPPSCWRARPRP